METKSFFFTPNRIQNISNVAAQLFKTSLVLILISCSSHQKRNEPPARESAPTANDSKVVTLPRATNVPKVGLILGPGGLKAFAHIGVLHELEKAHIPIHSVVGLEWGSLIGGLYSLKGKSNDVEWKMLKLKKEDLPSPTLFRSDIEPKNVGALEKFLQDVFENKSVSDSDISFSCPTTNVETNQTAWSSTSFKDSIMNCLPFPPMYKPYRDNAASAFNIKDAAKKLRDGGAEVVVLVNVLAQGVLIKSKKTKDSYATQLLWNELRNRVAQDQDAVDFVIGVHTREYDIMNFDARRSMILFGSQSGMIAAKKLSEKYGF